MCEHTCMYVYVSLCTHLYLFLKLPVSWKGYCWVRAHAPFKTCDLYNQISESLDMSVAETLFNSGESIFSKAIRVILLRHKSDSQCTQNPPFYLLFPISSLSRKSHSPCCPIKWPSGFISHSPSTLPEPHTRCPPSLLSVSGEPYPRAELNSLQNIFPLLHPAPFPVFLHTTFRVLMYNLCIHLCS